MDGEVNRVGRGFCTQHDGTTAARTGTDGVAGRAGLDARLAQLPQQRIDGMRESEECEVRLEPQADGGGRFARKRRGVERRERGIIEGDDARPLDARHVERQRGVRRGEGGMLFEKGRQELPEVAQ